MAKPAPQSALTDQVIEDVATSLRANANWRAACDYAGVSENTLNTWKQRAKQYERKLSGEDDLADLTARRLYADARDTWTTPGRRSEALSRLVDLDAHLDRDLDLPYWEAVQRWIKSRSRGEVELVMVIREAAKRGDWRAAQAMLRMGWPTRYSERIEVTGAEGGALAVEAQLVDVEARIQAGLEELKRKREATG